MRTPSARPMSNCSGGTSRVGVETPLDSVRGSSRGAIPVSTVNVQQHEALLQREKTPRKTRHEDCCGYCERYCQGKITNAKRSDIEAWRRDVNTKMEVQQAKQQKFHKKTKLRFLKPSHSPATPRSEEGFMRLPTPESGSKWASSGISTVKQANNKYEYWANTRKSNGHNIPRPATDPHDQQSLHTNLASLSAQPSTNKWVEDHYGFSVAKDKHSLTTPVLRTPSQPLQAGVRVPNISVESINDSKSDEAHSNSAQNSKVSSRTCSNELLNVITIDDATRHQRHKLLNKTPWVNSSSTESRSRERTDWAKPNLSYMVPTDSQGQPIHSLRQVLYPTESGYDTEGPTPMEHSHHEAVTRAIDNVVATREVLNNQAHRGLFKYDKSFNQPVVMHKESRRFQRMNNNLHKLMESQVLANSPMCQKIQERGGSAKMAKSDITARGKHGQLLSNSMSRLSPAITSSPNREGKMCSPESQFTTSRLLTSTPGKENFLEMLMDMEEH